MKNLLVLVLSVCSVSSVFSATVRDVVVRSHWPWDGRIDVHYVLETDRPVDIGLTATTNGAAVTIPPAAVAGGLCEVGAGTHTLVIDPSKAGLSAVGKLENFAVALTPTMAKTYMIVDLSDGLANTVAARISYTNEVIGAKTASNDDAIWRLWDDYYKTNAIVFRRCLAGTFLMGSRPGENNRPSTDALKAHETQHAVTLTRNFYIGVFELTQAQYYRVMGGYSRAYFTARRDMRPMENCNWDHWRANVSSGMDQYYEWPNEDLAVAHRVSSDSFFGKLRTLTGGGLLFDYPEDAQWEYAARAGVTTALPNGYDLTQAWNATHDENVDKIARYQYQTSAMGWKAAATTDPDEGATAIVGSYQPNDWGLFDVIGNVCEMCLDRYADTTADAVVDPVGPAEGTSRVVRGADWWSTPGNGMFRTAVQVRSSVATSGSDVGNRCGVRVAVTLY